MSQTGYFPSVRPNGKKRIDANGKQIFELRVRGINDGYVRTFVDDGLAEDGTPGQSRQVLARNLGKTTTGEDGTEHRVFAVDPGTKSVSFPYHGIKVTPAQIDASWEAECQRRCKARMEQEVKVQAFVAREQDRIEKIHKEAEAGFKVENYKPTIPEVLPEPARPAPRRGRPRKETGNG